MTAQHLGLDAERAARELARRLAAIVPPSLLADPYAFAIAFMADLVAEHWRHVKPPPDWHQTRTASPPTDDYRAARAALDAAHHETEPA